MNKIEFGIATKSRKVKKKTFNEKSQEKIGVFEKKSGKT